MDDFRFKSACRFAAINLAFFLLMAMNPYPRWMLPNGTFQCIFLFTTSLSLYRLKSLGYLFDSNSHKSIICCCIVLYTVFFALPIFHEFKGGYLLNAILFIEILFLDKDIYRDAYYILRFIFKWICVFSLLIWVVNYLKIPIPYYYYQPDFRYSSADNYHIYGLAVSLYDGANFIGGGLERICGIFAEPGHFGIYLGLMMAINKFRFTEKSDYIMLFTGIMTFSTAFYGILAIGLLYRLVEYQNLKDIKIFFLVGCFVFPLLFMNSSFYDSMLGRVIDNKKDISVVSLVENRVQRQSIEKFSRFLKTSQIWTGIYNKSENDVMQITNWRGGIYGYGILGVSIMLILIITIVSRNSFKYGLCLLAMAILVMSHRIYIMYSLGIIMIIFIACMVNNPLDEEYDEFENSAEEH